MEVSTSVFHVRNVWDYSTPKTNGTGMKWFFIHFLLVLLFVSVNITYLFHSRLKVVLCSPIPGCVSSSCPSLKYFVAFSFYYWTGKVTSADMPSSYRCWHQSEDKISDNNSPGCIQLVSGWEPEFWDEKFFWDLIFHNIKNSQVQLESRGTEPPEHFWTRTPACFRAPYAMKNVAGKV